MHTWSCGWHKINCMRTSWHDNIKTWNAFRIVVSFLRLGFIISRPVIAAVEVSAWTGFASDTDSIWLLVHFLIPNDMSQWNEPQLVHTFANIRRWNIATNRITTKTVVVQRYYCHELVHLLRLKILTKGNGNTKHLSQLKKKLTGHELCAFVKVLGFRLTIKEYELFNDYLQTMPSPI